jgi:hypothetical protein
VVGKKHAEKCPSLAPVAVHKPQGGLAGYAALLLERVFGPLHGQLEEWEGREFSSRLAHPISPRGRLDWPEVDEEIRELRRRLESATTQQDYRAVGMACVGVLEALSGVIYDPSVHLREGEEVPPRDKTKQRIGRFVETALVPYQTTFALLLLR